MLEKSEEEEKEEISITIIFFSMFTVVFGYLKHTERGAFKNLSLMLLMVQKMKSFLPFQLQRSDTVSIAAKEGKMERRKLEKNRKKTKKKRRCKYRETERQRKEPQKRERATRENIERERERSGTN